jgi:hypothetical protein
MPDLPMALGGVNGRARHPKPVDIGPPTHHPKRHKAGARPRGAAEFDIPSVRDGSGRGAPREPSLFARFIRAVTREQAAEQTAHEGAAYL